MFARHIITMSVYAKEQAERLIELEKNTPNRKIINEIIKQVKSNLFRCPSTMLNVPRDKIKDFGKKMMAYSNLRWANYRLDEYNPSLSEEVREFVVNELVAFNTKRR